MIKESMIEATHTTVNKEVLNDAVDNELLFNNLDDNYDKSLSLEGDNRGNRILDTLFSNR